MSKPEGIVWQTQEDRPSGCKATQWWILPWSLAQPLERRVTDWKDPYVNGMFISDYDED